MAINGQMERMKQCVRVKQENEMKTIFRLAAIFSVVFAATDSAPGQGTYTFSPAKNGNQSNGNWSLADAWWNGTAWGAWQDGNIARFYNPESGGVNSTITMNQNVSAAGLVREVDFNNFTVIAMAGNTLTLADGASILGDLGIFAIQYGTIAGNNLTVSAGTGSVRFGHPTGDTVANTINGLTLEDGTLTLDKNSGVAAVGGNVTVNGGTLSHGASATPKSQQYAAGSTLTLNGGTVQFHASSQILDSLTLNAGTVGAAAGAVASLAGSDALTLRNIALPTGLKTILLTSA